MIAMVLIVKALNNQWHIRLEYSGLVDFQQGPDALLDLC